MERNPWSVLWRVIVVALALQLAAAPSGAARAREAPPAAADWESIGPDGPIFRLFAPTSGALLAAGEGRLLRSDDGGATWRGISLPEGAGPSFGLGSSYRPRPAGQGTLAVDPTNHDVLYVAATGGLRKSADGGATWASLPVEGSVVALAVSPANPAYVHVVVRGPADPREWRRLRSRDGGTSWQQLSQLADRSSSSRPPSDYEVYLLQPHPTDPERIFIAAGGTTGRSTQVSLEDIYDGPGPRPGPEVPFDPGYFSDAEHLVGGGGGAPGRFYATFSSRVSPYNQSTETKLLRADEGGAQTTLLEIDGSGGVNGTTIGQSLPPAVFADALAYDPRAPDRVFVGLNEYTVTVTGSSYPQSVQLARARGHVIASADGGATWSALGREDLGAEIRDLALGIDGANLYAATETGLFRLRLDAVPGG